MKIKHLIKAAKGETTADILFKNARLVNVFSGEIEKTSVAIKKSWIAGIGDNYQAKKVIDLKGLYLCPGFIDGHVHIESSLVVPSEYAKAVVPLGTTTVVIDPHEIANVFGLAGIRYMLESAKYNHLNIFVMLPSSVPVSDMETSGARLLGEDLYPLLSEKWVRGIAEVPYPGVLATEKSILDKIKIGKNKRVDGHAPSLTGKELCAYIAAGIGSDHESTTIEEAKEKLDRGMYVMLREGSAAKNLETLLPLVNIINARRFLFVSDDCHPDYLLEHGHINYIIKKAISLGLNPITAIQMATLNAAEYFRFDTMGAIAPGYWADLIVFDNLKDLNIKMVYRGGVLAASEGKYLEPKKKANPPKLRSSINITHVDIERLALKRKEGKLQVIEIIPGQIYTKKTLVTPKVNSKEEVVPDFKKDIIKLVVVERHEASGNIGIGFVKGLGLKKGAIGSTVAHDSHNIIIAGTSDQEILQALIYLVRQKGGQVVIENGKPIESLPLPIAGLMSDKPLVSIAKKVKKLCQATQKLGSQLNDPFMALSFLALPVIPELKLTDKGLVDVGKFKIVSPFIKE